MSNKQGTISACLVVYNEETVIERCLRSLVGLVDEIIIIHDGECTDKTLEIARKYTDKIFIEPHVGIAEPHRSKSFCQASSEWILPIDADEYIEVSEHAVIKQLTKQQGTHGWYFLWELWDGKYAVSCKGLQKLALFRKDKSSFQGLPQKEVLVEGNTQQTILHLRHRPTYENISWATAKKKREYWLQAHVLYYLPTRVRYHCFQTTIDSWLVYVERVRAHPWRYILWYPVKNCLGQLKNGLWTSRIGLRIALQQYLYYVTLYVRVYQANRRQNSMKKTVLP